MTSLYKTVLQLVEMVKNCPDLRDVINERPLKASYYYMHDVIFKDLLINSFWRHSVNNF